MRKIFGPSYLFSRRTGGNRRFSPQRGLHDLFAAWWGYRRFFRKGDCPISFPRAGIRVFFSKGAVRPVFLPRDRRKNGRAQRCAAAERSELMGNECVFGFFMPARRGYACSFPACRSSSRARTRRGIRCGRAEHRKHWRLHPSSARWSSCAIRP